eukprot:767895-Hanusia_phi.AAC.2
MQGEAGGMEDAAGETDRMAVVESEDDSEEEGGQEEDPASSPARLRQRAAQLCGDDLPMKDQLAAKSALGRDMLGCGMAENAYPLLCDVLAVHMLSSPLDEAAIADTLELVAQALVGMCRRPCRSSHSPPCREGAAWRSHRAV